MAIIDGTVFRYAGPVVLTARSPAAMTGKKATPATVDAAMAAVVGNKFIGTRV